MPRRPRETKSDRDQRRAAELEAKARRARSREHFNGSLSEFAVFEALLDEGWEVFVGGWPDFVAVKNGAIRVIEVKAHRYDHPNPRQRRMFKVLRALGIEVEVIRPGDVRRGGDA